VCFTCVSLTGFLSLFKPTLFRVASVGTAPITSDLLAPTFTTLGFGRGGIVDTGAVLFVPVPGCFIVAFLTVPGAVAGRLCGFAAAETAAFFVTAGLAMSPLLRTEDLLVVPDRGCADTVDDLMAVERGLVGDVTPGLGLSAAAGGLVVLPAGGRGTTGLGLLGAEGRVVVVDGGFGGWEEAEVADFLGVEERTVVVGAGFVGETGCDFCSTFPVPVVAVAVLLLTAVFVTFDLTAAGSFLSTEGDDFLATFFSGALASSAGFSSGISIS